MILAVIRLQHTGKLLKHHRSDPQHFGLLRDFDSFRHALSEETSTSRESFVAELADALSKHEQNPSRRHGFRTQTMFAYVAAALDQCDLINEVDTGDFYSRNLELRRPDFHIITTPGDQFLVEVKNHHSADPFTPIRLKKAYIQSLTNYARIVNLPLFIAIYWSRWNLWTLNRSDRLIDDGKKFVLSFGDAMKRNDMRRVGDYMVDSIPPLAVRVYTDPSKPREIREDGTVLFTVGRVCMIADQHELTTKLEQDIAWFLMQYGKWNRIELPVQVRGTQLLSLDFQQWPEQQTNGQLFEGHGFLSQLLSNAFLERVPVDRLSPDSEPSDLGTLIPYDFKSNSLKLFRGILHPTFTSRHSTV